jgi:hypothetical protein
MKNKKGNSNRSRNNRASRPANGFSFYFKFIKKDLENYKPRERMRIAARMWHSLSNEEKNNYKKFANDERILNEKPPVDAVSSDTVINNENNEKKLVFIFSDLSSVPLNDSKNSDEEFFNYEKYYKDQ